MDVKSIKFHFLTGGFVACQPEVFALGVAGEENKHHFLHQNKVTHQQVGRAS